MHIARSIIVLSRRIIFGVTEAKLQLQVSHFHGGTGINGQRIVKVQGTGRRNLRLECESSAIGAVGSGCHFPHWGKGVHQTLTGLTVARINPDNTVDTGDDIGMVASVCTGVDPVHGQPLQVAEFHGGVGIDVQRGTQVQIVHGGYRRFECEAAAIGGVGLGR